jgi:tripartite-type tricarboxylate transporter receptor subunit TctC
VIDNRGGAAGTIGVDLTAKAAPDGYTIVIGYIAPITVNVSLMKLPYDPVRDLAPITNLALAQNVLVVHPSLPAATVKELIALLRSRPGQYNYASAGNGSSPHLSAELFKLMAKVGMNHVPYKGAGPAIVDLISGQVSMYFGSQPSSMPHIRAGKVRALAVTGARRSALTPEIPTIAESGLPGFESIQWYGLLAPARTPPAILDKLNRDFVSVLTTPDVKERLFTQGYEVVGDSREQFGAFIKSEISKWAQVVKEARIRVD